MYIELTETYNLIDEGTVTLQVVEVDDTRYESDGVIRVRFQDARGTMHIERFHLRDAEGRVNHKAMRAWSHLVRTCVDNYALQAADTQDIVGRFITAEASHVSYTRKNGPNAGTRATGVSIRDYRHAEGFEGPGIPAENRWADESDDPAAPNREGGDGAPSRRP